MTGAVVENFTPNDLSRARHAWSALSRINDLFCTGAGGRACGSWTVSTKVGRDRGSNTGSAGADSAAG
ncbi:MAG: hypothetical protein OEL78_04620 [Hyphomicrobiales bacterium]|nr:hypothetical protein [Hyphomicrobiales bacterium]